MNTNTDIDRPPTTGLPREDVSPASNGHAPAPRIPALIDRVVQAPYLSAFLFVGFSVLFFVLTGWLASRKPFWTDELHVVHLARLSSLGELWESLFARPDAMPPLVHFATYFLGHTFGFTHLTARLPAIVGYWLLCASIFFYLRRRVSPLVAALGMALPLTVPAIYFYSLEARGYGLMLGFSGLAVLCWDLAGGTRGRWLALVGLALSFAAAIASHLFAVLLFVPLALAELARSWERRRVDYLVWGFLLAGWGVLLPLRPLLPNMQRIGAMMAGPDALGLHKLLAIWSQFFSTPFTYFGLLLLACLFRRREEPAAQARDAEPLARASGSCGGRTSEYVLAVGIACLPLVGFAFGRVMTGVLTLRYVLPTVIGFALLVPLLCREVVRGYAHRAALLLGWVLCAVPLVVWDIKTGMFEVGQVATGRGYCYLLAVADRVPDDGRPIVVTEYHSFMALHHYAPEALRKRLAFVADYDAWILPDAWMHERLYGQHMSSLDEFLRKHPSFYVYDCETEGRKSPLVAKLVRMGGRLEDSGLLETENLFPRPGYLYLLSGFGAGK